MSAWFRSLVSRDWLLRAKTPKWAAHIANLCWYSVSRSAREGACALRVAPFVSNSVSHSHARLYNRSPPSSMRSHVCRSKSKACVLQWFVNVGVGVRYNPQRSNQGVSSSSMRGSKHQQLGFSFQPLTAENAVRRVRLIQLARVVTPPFHGAAPISSNLIVLFPVSSSSWSSVHAAVPDRIVRHVLASPWLLQRQCRTLLNAASGVSCRLWGC
jgi:hypothetical protein